MITKIGSLNLGCSHVFQDKEVRERSIFVGRLNVSPYWDPNTPDDELAGERNIMYSGRSYICINCDFVLNVPGKPRKSKFLDRE